MKHKSPSPTASYFQFQSSCTYDDALMKSSV
jgi:hypothetical protein